MDITIERETTFVNFTGCVASLESCLDVFQAASTNDIELAHKIYHLAWKGRNKAFLGKHDDFNYMQ